MSKSIDKASFLSSKKLELLESRLRQKGIGTLETRVITRREETDTCPLSFAQQRLWFLHQLEPQSTAYLLPSAQRLQGALDLLALERSLAALLLRHESLRTTFQVRADQPLQIIHPLGVLRLPLIDLRGLAPA